MKLPRHPLPCFRLGRLVCRSDQQGRGLGRLLIGCGFILALVPSQVDGGT